MPSPFPGMDPYIERHELWSDFHNNLASEIQARLNQVIQPRYFARLNPYEASELVAISRREELGFQPDVGVYHETPPIREAAVDYSVIARPSQQLSVPVEFSLILYTVEVYQTADRELVAVIEVLSPANKRISHEAFFHYQRKRVRMLHLPVHFMEIDLLRGGERFSSDPPTLPAPYFVFLHRAGAAKIDGWPIQLPDRLPVLPVPLLAPDPDAPLNLGAAVAAVYERGAYARQINYRQPPPPPPLSEEEAAWVEGLLKEKGLR